MRTVARLCQGLAERLDWRSREPRPDYLGALLDGGARTLPETLAHML